MRPFFERGGPVCFRIHVSSSDSFRRVAAILVLSRSQRITRKPARWKETAAAAPICPAPQMPTVRSTDFSWPLEFVTNPFPPEAEGGSTNAFPFIRSRLPFWRRGGDAFQPAADAENFTGNPTCLGTAEKCDRVGDVLRFAPPSQRDRTADGGQQ